MSKENVARNIVVMKPDAFLGLGKFSLAVIPQHDNPPDSKNVVKTLTAPNMMDEDKLEENGKKLRGRISGLKDNTIGLFIGGDNPNLR